MSKKIEEKEVGSLGKANLQSSGKREEREKSGNERKEREKKN
jgi:hypothetical protein